MPIYAIIAAVLSNLGAVALLIVAPRLEREQAERLVPIGRGCVVLVVSIAALALVDPLVELSSRLPADDVSSKAMYLACGISGAMNGAAFVLMFGALPWLAKRALRRRVAKLTDSRQRSAGSDRED